LIEAFSRLPKNVGAKLMILGEGSLRTHLQDLVHSLNLAESVAFLGFQANPFKFMKSCDVFVLSSNFEGLPNVLLQALACGAKVVSTDCNSGPREILEDGKWGQLVPVNDVEALTQAIVTAFDGDQLVDVKERARQFSVGNSVRQYLRLLQS
jgi:glycosyltransferase involved in cell wall biosynthesis